MSPFQYQLDLIKKYEQDNELAMLRLASAEAVGNAVTATMTLYGPYMTHVIYQMNNGEFITLVSPSSLAWVPLPLYV